MANRTIVLKNDQIRQKIQRIAYEIYENNFEADKILLVGIDGQGFTLASRISEILKTICAAEITLCKISLNKDFPLEHPVKLSVDENLLKDMHVVLIDDVLNSGKTLIYAAKHLLDVSVKKLSTACLVDRRHRRYPVRADFVGLTLSTTLQEKIEVEFNDGNDTVYLI